MARNRFRVRVEVVRPWATGMAVLTGLVWLISWLLDVQQIGGQAVGDEMVAPIAMTDSTTPEEPSGLAPIPLADLLPLGPEDTGFRVTVKNSVVAQPIEAGFWILTDEDEVIFVVSGENATSGADVELTGTLQQSSSAEGASRAAQAGLRGAAGWKVHHTLYLATDTRPGRDRESKGRGRGDEPEEGADRDPT